MPTQSEKSRSLLHSDRGTSVLEYGLILAVLAIALYGIVTTFKLDLGHQFTSVASVERPASTMIA